MTDLERWKLFIRLLDIDWNRWSFVVAERSTSASGQLVLFVGKKECPLYSEQFGTWVDLAVFASKEEESAFYRLGTVSTSLIQISPKDSLVRREEVLGMDKLEELKSVDEGLGQTLRAYAVWVNSDLTEGRGYEYPQGIYEAEVTARRAAKGVDVQGGNGRIVPTTLYKVQNLWYGPVNLVRATEADRREEKILLEKEEELVKIEKLEQAMLKAGFSAEDLELFLKKAAR